MSFAGRTLTQLYLRATRSAGPIGVPYWPDRLVPSSVRSAWSWRSERAEEAASTAIGPEHWLGPAMERISGWSITPLTLDLLGRLLESRRPVRILECGGGVSTLAFALHARRERERGRDVSIVSLEHDADWLEKTRGMLEESGLASFVAFVHAPLLEGRAYGRAQIAYAPPSHFAATMAAGRPVDFLLIDGPPGTVGRLGSLALAEPFLANGATILLDDAFRPGERAIWSTWKREATGRLARPRLHLTSRGLASATWSLTKRSPQP